MHCNNEQNMENNFLLCICINSKKINVEKKNFFIIWIRLTVTAFNKIKFANI